MKSLRLILCVILLIATARAEEKDRDATSEPAQTGVSDVRFEAVNVFIDPADQPLAAYQIEFTADRADITLVGIEGGEHPAFAQPPYYDAKAQLANRIILAALNTGADLPRRETRVATVMLRVIGKQLPQYGARLIVAASSDAKPIAARVTVSVARKPVEKSSTSLLNPSLRISTLALSSEGAKR